MAVKNIIHWGIIGLGKIARTFAQDLQRAGDAVIYGVASRSNDKAKTFAAEFKAAKSYGSYEALAADPEIDVVYIATPHVFHFESTMMCLKHGKHVLCEKPLGMNAAQVKTIIAKARERKLFLMEGIWTRFIPATNLLLDLIQKGTIGEIISVRADFGFKGNPDPSARLYNKELGGGSLLDIGIYPVYLNMLLLGMPTEIKAMARITDTGVDGYCSVLLDFAGGEKAVLESTFETHTPTEARVFGTEGMLKLHASFHHSRRVSTYRDGRHYETLEVNYMGNGYIDEIEEVHHCLKNKLLESDKLPLKSSLDLITVLERVRQEIGLTYTADFDN
jgi:predicted dehydrogenase